MQSYQQLINDSKLESMEESSRILYNEIAGENFELSEIKQ